MIRVSRRILVVALTIFLVSALLPLFQTHCVSAQTDQTETALQAANTAVERAFTAVSAAQEAGANVTSVLSSLNAAEGLLAQAENAYRTGDNLTAINDSSAVLPITQEVAKQAQSEQESALASGQAAFRFTIAATIVVVVVFVAALFLVWRLFKRSYIKGLSNAKPEVSTSEIE